jgi:hypothetical protein
VAAGALNGRVQSRAAFRVVNEYLCVECKNIGRDRAARTLIAIGVQW